RSKQSRKAGWVIEMTARGNGPRLAPSKANRYENKNEICSISKPITHPTNPTNYSRTIKKNHTGMQRARVRVHIKTKELKSEQRLWKQKSDSESYGKGIYQEQNPDPQTPLKRKYKQ